MKVIRWAVLVLLIILALLFLVFGLPNRDDPKVDAAAPATTTFDHSDCQYPYRWSNPIDGCDNSDPAVPECIKFADSKESEQACIDEFVKANQPAEPSQTTTQPGTVKQPEVPVCGGK